MYFRIKYGLGDESPCELIQEAALTSFNLYDRIAASRLPQHKYVLN